MSSMPSASKTRCSRGRSLRTAIPAFPLSNETKVEENQEEDGMDNGSHAADARRLDKTRAEDRHRNPVEVQIEKDSGVHKEGARKELAYVLPQNPSKHVRLLLMFLIEWIYR
jgi:D-serine deaminase-like pyridoxal phosphate-dependent protein